MACVARIEGLRWRPLGRRDPTIDGLDLTVAAGERVLLVGASGSGKSTVLAALAGALGTTLTGELSGSVTVHGRVGLVLQNPADSVVADRVGRDVAFGPENLGLPREQIWRRVDAALDVVGLTQPRSHRTSALSGGEQQRLALAGALALQPDLLLLDEPTAMLDDATAATVRDAVARAVSGAVSLIVVEHRFAPWLDHVDRVVVLGGRGRVEFDGSVGDFLDGPVRPDLWMPGRNPPEQADVPPEFVRPAATADRVVADGVGVDLVSRTLRGRLRHAALRDFDADLRPGTTTALTGRSGAGKSTALLTLGGLVRPVRGRVTPDFAALRSRRLAGRVGWVPQNPELGFCAVTVADEVRATSRALGRDVDPLPLLDVMGLARFAGTHPYRLSGGEQRRLALVAALAHRPGVALLDEPTVGQDPLTWAAVTGWCARAAECGATVGFSTHDVDAPRDRELRLEPAR